MFAYYLPKHVKLAVITLSNDFTSEKNIPCYLKLVVAATQQKPRGFPFVSIQCWKFPQKSAG